MELAVPSQHGGGCLVNAALDFPPRCPVASCVFGGAGTRLFCGSFGSSCRPRRPEFRGDSIADDSPALGKVRTALLSQTRQQTASESQQGQGGRGGGGRGETCSPDGSPGRARPPRANRTTGRTDPSPPRDGACYTTIQHASPFFGIVLFEQSSGFFPLLV